MGFVKHPIISQDGNGQSRHSNLQIFLLSNNTNLKIVGTKRISVYEELKPQESKILTLLCSLPSRRRARSYHANRSASHGRKLRVRELWLRDQEKRVFGEVNSQTLWKLLTWNDVVFTQLLLNRTGKHPAYIFTSKKTRLRPELGHLGRELKVVYINMPFCDLQQIWS